MPECKPRTKTEQLKMEKEVTGFYISGHPLDEYKREMQHFGKQKIADFKDDFKTFRNRPLVFGGMVTSAQDKMTKTNKPYGVITIEDFEDSLELRLFSEDYLKFKHFLTEGFFLLINARIQQRYNSESQFELKINNIMLLPEVLERETKVINLSLSLKDLTNELIENIEKLAKKNKGKCRLGFLVKDTEDKLMLSMNSINFKVNPKEFLNKIDNIGEIGYKLG
ncbi:MAG: hypothetical protein B6D64_09815 [Bacteroidetes bacterium 4484_276]|nr:MAG: hypothetical protein B6D64_09815 [Bacteroidetes bacterium 4484_276]